MSSIDTCVETNGDACIDIIVPVHNNFRDAARLFDALRSVGHIRRARLIVVDDASTEGFACDLAAKGGAIEEVLCLRNDRNLGFAASVNRALAMSRRDVVLLNSDTLVSGAWLDRMCEVAASRHDAGIVTPLSNAATIYSYPFMARDYGGRLEIEWSELDRLCALPGAEPVVMPTGVGFCMLIKRACLDEVGALDDIAFASGYGEESDFCRRALAAGWLSIAATNVFVWHRGQGSFGARAALLRDGAEALLRTRYPTYAAEVRRFIRRDPLAAVRRRLDLRRLQSDGRRTDLVVGTSAGRQASANVKTIYFEVDRAGIGRFRPVVGGFGPLPNLQAFHLFSRASTVRTFLEEANVSTLRIPTNGLPWPLRATFVRTAVSLGLSVDRQPRRRPGAKERRQAR